MALGSMQVGGGAGQLFLLRLSAIPRLRRITAVAICACASRHSREALRGARLEAADSTRGSSRR